MKTQPGGLLSEGVYDPYVFEADLAAIAEFYHARGYLDARVGHRLEYDTRKERLLPVVTIEEGSLYRVEQIVIRGSTVFSPPEILRAFRLKQGAPYSELLLREDLRTLEQMYQKKGHMGAAIERHLTFAEKGASVSVEIDVRDEGPAATIERVDIRGNNVTKDHVIRRYITVLPGDPVDPSKLDAIRERLLNTGLFSAAPEGGREAVEVFLEDGSAPGKKNLVVEVNDDIRGQFTIGATWNSDLGPMGLIELVHYNFDFTDWPRDFRDAREGTAFAGGGQQLTIRLAPGPKYSDFRLSWLNPSVADSAYSFGWDLYANEWAAHDYDRGATGVSLTGGRRFLDDKLSVTLTPGYERLTLGNVDSDAAADIRAAEGTYNRHYLTLGVAYDARDDRVEPTKGYLAALDLTNVGSFLGGDVDVVKERVHGAYYATLVDSPRWGKHVMSFTGVLGLTQSTGGDGVPFFERYFTSGVGGNRLRGFEYNGIGPVDRKSGDHVGGECLVLGGAEYTFPLYREVVRGALFLDAGDLERRFGDIGLDHVRVSVGFGLRFRLFGGRLGPISLDFGFPVKKLPTDDRQVFSFSIGGSYQF
jgi:outer membrane protein insertion porin family